MKIILWYLLLSVFQQAPFHDGFSLFVNEYDEICFWHVHCGDYQELSTRKGLGWAMDLWKTALTKPILGEQILGRRGRFPGAGFVDCFNPELVCFAFDQVGDASLSFVTGDLWKVMFSNLHCCLPHFRQSIRYLTHFFVTLLQTRIEIMSYSKLSFVPFS